MPREINDVDDTYVDKKTGKRKPKVDKEQVWMIDILIPNKYLYNDEVYDLNNVQDKLKDEQETNQDMENMITNEQDDANVEI